MNHKQIKIINIDIFLNLNPNFELYYNILMKKDTKELERIYFGDKKPESIQIEDIKRVADF